MFGATKTRRHAAVAEAVVAGAALATALAGCGSGDSTVAKTPTVVEVPSQQAEAAGPTNPEPAEPDPCAVNLAAPAIAKAVSELPRDPRSGQPWNPEPLAGNYSECADLSGIIIKANTNGDNPSTRAVLFHRGQYLPQAVPDTYGFDGIDVDRSSGDTVVLQHPSGVPGLIGVVKFRWNGSAVEIASNAA